ncbi:MAG: hypothetical protein LW629_08495 [Burkholderiales bacterium]|jgi:hypothetical protein|nr:hypothetical protein [Burkholderiales bacterium]
MKTICRTIASLILASTGTVFAGAAQAELMYHVTFSDIEGAVMPAVPFPSESSIKAEPATGAPASLGLAPSAGPQANEPAAAVSELPQRKRPLSASETSDLFLR